MALVEGIQNKAWVTHTPIHVHSMKELHEMEGATPPGAGGPPEMAGGGMMELPELPDGPDGPGFPPVPKDLTAAGCPRRRDHYPDRKTRCHRAACLRRPVGVPSVKPPCCEKHCGAFPLCGKLCGVLLCFRQVQHGIPQPALFP